MRNKFMRDLIEKKTLIFDGGQGTMLQERGLSAGSAPELMNLEARESVFSVHRDYLLAGANVLTTNTFGANRIKLAEYDLADKVFELNTAGIEIAREAADGKALVAASVGPTGRFAAPLGSDSFADMYDVFSEQAKAVAAAGADLIILETFSDLGEVRAALLAFLDHSTAPIICSLTYENGRTLTGVTPQIAALVLSGMGASAIGANCSGGPAELYPILAEIAGYTDLPLIVQPNAGLPVFKDNKVVYPLEAEEFSGLMRQFYELGVEIIGSCCGSTPAHTAELVKEFGNKEPLLRSTTSGAGVLTGAQAVASAGSGLLPLIIGERINPTARKKIAEDLRNKEYGSIQNEAVQQLAAGAMVLDVNVGTPGLDEVETMSEVVNLLQKTVTAPLCLDSTDPQVLQAALETYHGKALINSVNGDEESMAAILPLAARYGAAIIALALDEKGIPDSAEERLAIVKRIVERADEYGIPRGDIFVDTLVMTVATNPDSALETLGAIKLVKDELGTNTVLGVSNISHGLPNRSKLNATFFALAIEAGLDAALINPLDERMMDAWQSASYLVGRDLRGENYLALNSEVDTAAEAKDGLEGLEGTAKIKEMVVRGNKDIEKAIIGLLDAGHLPLEIINEGLATGLDIVGEKFEKGEYYLPQLLFSAETAQSGFNILEAELAKTGEVPEEKGTVVIGTVKGDVHDIGKNMVAIMLKNHGYRIIDLGKNVSPAEFLTAVQEEKADILALSSLMTTTMTNIPLTVELVRKNAPTVKIIAGGAVVTAEYAEDSACNGFSGDAVGAVKLANRLLSGEKTSFMAEI